MTRHNGKRILSALCMLLPCSVFAKSGGVNYSWGSGRAGFHARLCGDDDALCPVRHLRGCRRFCGHSRIPDIYQDEHGRGRNHQAHTLAGRGLPFHHRCDNSLSGIFRLSNLENHECKTINKVQLKQDKHV